MKLFSKYIDKTLLRKDIIKYRKYILSIIIFLLAYVIGLRIYNVIIIKTKKEQEQQKMNLSSEVFATFVYYIVIFLGLLLALINSDIDTKSIMVLLGSAGLAIALAMQSSLTRVINGFIILYYKYFEIGDIIKVDEIIGRVVNFTLFSTTIITRENNVRVIISNNDIVAKKVINYTMLPTIINNVRVSISSNNNNLSYINLINVIKSELMEKTKYIDKKQIDVNVHDIEKHGTILNIRFGIKSEDLFASENEVRLIVRDVLSRQNVKLLDYGYIN